MVSSMWDPGVGSSRRILAAFAQRVFFPLQVGLLNNYEADAEWRGGAAIPGLFECLRLRTGACVCDSQIGH